MTVCFSCLCAKCDIGSPEKNPSTKAFVPSGQVKQPTLSAFVVKIQQNNDYVCASCGGFYSDDTKKKCGTELIQYAFC